MCVRACVTQFSLKLLLTVTCFFCKFVVLMNFDAVQYFLVFVNFGLLLSVIAHLPNIIKWLVTLKLLHVSHTYNMVSSLEVFLHS